MNIDLRHFVDINIQKHIDATIVGTRDVVALFTNVGTYGRRYSKNNVMTNIVSSYSEAVERYANQEGSSTLLQYLEVFFEHNGSKVAVYEGYNKNDGNEYHQLTVDDIKALPDEYICVASTCSSYAEIEAFAISLSNEYGIKEKILMSRINDNDAYNISTKNFCVKYSNIVGAEMTMAAYLSQIDVYKVNTVFDYAFTQELLPVENIDEDKYELLMQNNINVNIELANASRVCGGNCKDGAELTNNFVRIVLHQTLTNRLIALLTEKLKSNSGLGKIYSTIAQELNYYLNCGYLTTDKIWTDATLTETYNGQSYTIIEKGTALVNGYVAKVLPLTALSTQDKQLHKAPPIYVIIADQYSIRAITINGEVI